MNNTPNINYPYDHQQNQQQPQQLPHQPQPQQLNGQNQSNSVLSASIRQNVDPKDIAILQQSAARLKFLQEQIKSNMAQGNDASKNSQLIIEFQQLQQQHTHIVFRVQQQLQQKVGSPGVSPNTAAARPSNGLNIQNRPLSNNQQQPQPLQSQPQHSPQLQHQQSQPHVPQQQQHHQSPPQPPQPQQQVPPVSHSPALSHHSISLRTPSISQGNVSNSTADPNTSIPNSAGPPGSVGAGQGPMNDAMKKKLNLQIQTDLFIKTLTNFLKTQNKTLNNQFLVVDNKPVNLFILYFLVGKMGGFQLVTNNNQWEIVAQRLNFIGNDNNPGKAAMQIFNVYKDYLLGFEIFLKTPEGQKQLEFNKRQKLLEMQQQQSQTPVAGIPQTPAAPVPALAPTAVPAPVPITAPVPSAPQQTPKPFANPQQPMGPPQNFKISNPGTPQIPPNNVELSKPENSGSISAKASPQMNSASTPNQFNQRPTSALGRSITSSAAQVKPEQARLSSQVNISNFPEPPKVRENPQILRKYDPTIRSFNGFHAGHILKKLVLGGEQIDSLKPNYLFPPEIGNINLHALTMSLQSYSLSEVNNALNMLLVISADQRMEIQVSECEEILDRVSELGLSILDELIYQDLNNMGGQHYSDLGYRSVYKEKLNKKTEQKDNFRVSKLSKRLRKKDLYKFESFSLEDLDQVSPYQKYSSHNMDNIFNEFIAQNSAKDGLNDVEIVIDSFTGEEVAKKPKIDFEQLEGSKQFGNDKKEPTINVSNKGFHEYITNKKIFKLDARDSYIDESFLPNVGKFSLPSYIDLLIKSHDEMDDPFSEVNIRSTESYQIMLIDQLLTISMILRNLSYTENNKRIFAANEIFKSFLFKLVFSLYAFDEYFVYSRRKLSLLKDCLMLFMNISHLLKLRGFFDALIVVILSIQFGGSPNKGDANTEELQRNSRNLVPEYQPHVDKYQSYAIDMVAKILANSPENRFLVKCVATDTFKKPNIHFSSNNNSNNNNNGKNANDDESDDNDEQLDGEEDEEEEDDDHIHDERFYNNLGLDSERSDDPRIIFTHELSKLYLSGRGLEKSSSSSSFVLFEKLFALLTSVFPFHSLLNGTLEIEERSPIILQGLLAGNLLIKMIPVGPIGNSSKLENQTVPNIALDWLLSHESIGATLLRIGFILAAIPTKPGKEHLNLISARALAAVNLLFQKIFQYINVQQSSSNNNYKIQNVGSVDDNIDDLVKLLKLPGIVPSPDTILGSLISQNFDPVILKEVLQLASYSRRLKEQLLIDFNK